MADCIFCKIVSGKVPSEKIWENEDFVAFADAHPVEEGHSLVISKKHFDNLSNVFGKESEMFISAIQQAASALMKKYNSQGFNVVLNNGKAAGQVVNHVHFHLLPRKEGDGKRGIFLG